MLIDGATPITIRCSEQKQGEMGYSIDTKNQGPLKGFYTQSYDREFVRSLFRDIKKELIMGKDVKHLKELCMVAKNQLMPDNMDLSAYHGEHVIIETRDHGFLWELLCGDEDFYGLAFKMGRTLVWRSEKMRSGPHKEMKGNRALIIINPTGDLKNAEKESVKLVKQFREQGIGVDCLFREYATLTEVSLALNKGEYSFIHYCGHVVTDESGSALLLHDNQRLNAGAIAKFRLGNPMVFLNGCASSASEYQPMDDAGLMGLVDAFAGAGASCIVGTLVDVKDGVAAKFADVFYKRFLNSETIGAAIAATKREMLRANELNSLAYTLFGSPSIMYMPDALAQVMNASELMRIIDVHALAPQLIKALNLAVLEGKKQEGLMEIGVSKLLTCLCGEGAFKAAVLKAGYDPESIKEEPVQEVREPLHFSNDIVRMLMDISAMPASEQVEAFLNRLLEKAQASSLIEKRKDFISREDVDEHSWNAFLLSRLLIPDQVISTYSYSLCLSMLQSHFASIVGECGGEIKKLPKEAQEALTAFDVDTLHDANFSKNMLKSLRVCIGRAKADEQEIIKELLSNKEYSMNAVFESLRVDMALLKAYYKA
ncbi:CHAT domain-containing protein [Christensenellaceae bacterium OttesenSCG-928-M15]|nr:CHAT domain-containing protein [Christensenellaceae bacterium OttesenSCG-928-M15]